MKRIPNLVRSRTVILKLTRDNTSPKAKWQSRFQTKFMHLHAHGKHIYCWSDSSKRM